MEPQLHVIYIGIQLMYSTQVNFIDERVKTTTDIVIKING